MMMLTVALWINLTRPPVARGFSALACTSVMCLLSAYRELGLKGKILGLACKHWLNIDWRTLDPLTVIRNGRCQLKVR